MLLLVGVAPSIPLSLEKNKHSKLKFYEKDSCKQKKTITPKIDMLRNYFVQERSQTTDKSLAYTLVSTLTIMKYDGSRAMHDHILEMTTLVAK